MDQTFEVITTRSAYTLQKVGENYIVTRVKMEEFRGVVGLVVGFTTDTRILTQRVPFKNCHDIIERWQPALRNKIRMQFVLIRTEALASATQQALDPTAVVISEPIEIITPKQARESNPTQVNMPAFRRVA